MKRFLVVLLLSILILSADTGQYALLKLGQTDSCSNSTAIAADGQDRIFVARGNGGLSVYSFDIINGFTELASVNNGGTAVDVDVMPDGQTVFLANSSDGLRVYSFANDSLSNIYHMALSTEGGECTRIDLETVNRVYVENDTSIMIIRRTIWTDTMRPRTYEYGTAGIRIWGGDTLSNPDYGDDVRYGHMYPSDPYDGFPGRISDYEPFDENSDLLACGEDGIKHDYRGDGPRKNTGDFVRDIHVLSDSTILVANSGGGLKAYHYTDQFELAAQIDEGGQANRLHENSDGILFLANGTDGLRVYGFDTTFHTLAHACDGGNVKDIVELSDGTLIVTNDLGLIAYSFADTSSSHNDHGSPDVDGYALNSNYPNPFNPTTTISYQLPAISDVNLSVFSLSGCRINQWSCQSQSAGTYEITWNGKDQAGNQMPSGVYIYRMVAGEFVKSRKMVLLK